MSYREYNGKVGFGLFCPITRKVKGYPFEIAVTGTTISGCVLADQVRSLDWTVRDVEYVGKLDDEKLDDVIANMVILMRKWRPLCRTAHWCVPRVELAWESGRVGSV